MHHDFGPQIQRKQYDDFPLRDLFLTNVQVRALLRASQL